MDNTDGPISVSIESNSKEDGTQAIISNTAHINTNTVRNRNVSRDPNSEHESRRPSNQQSFEDSCIVIPQDVNDVEAHRIANNYYFGFKKWKSHVTDRPLSIRSEIVQDLYTDISKLKPVRVSTLRPFNIIYVLLFGWWVALIYLVVAFLMMVTVVGHSYASFCWMLAKYFLWPFGKFVHKIHPDSSMNLVEDEANYNNIDGGNQPKDDESTALLDKTSKKSQCYSCKQSSQKFWRTPQTYLWMVFGVPILVIIHGVVMAICWFFVITIPIAKVNMKTITSVLFMPPDQIEVGDSSRMNLNSRNKHSEIIMYTHQAINVYYYKYTVDGMNVILVNLLLFVIVSLIVGYTDEENKYTNGLTKCLLSTLAIIPLTYYIGMGIISVSAQSSFAVGAVLNATFGSIVELILYIVALNKGLVQNSQCYVELVKSAITGILHLIS
ncbi:hypothetical protein ScPMuIL_011036 [Solemya velum]